MKTLGLLFAALALSGCGAPVSSLPTAFHGQWDLTPALCRDVDGVSRLVVDATGLGFYESGGELKGPAVRLGDRVGGTFHMSGTDYQDTHPDGLDQSGELVLTDHGEGLILTLQGHRQNYVRCTGNRA